MNQGNGGSFNGPGLGRIANSITYVRESTVIIESMTKSCKSRAYPAALPDKPAQQNVLKLPRGKLLPMLVTNAVECP